MATVKKSKGKTLRSQYEQILQDKGYTLSECKILAFKFPSLTLSHKFHYDLLHRHISYLLYDGVNEIVKIVIDKECDKEIFADIASLSEGTFTTLLID